MTDNSLVSSFAWMQDCYHLAQMGVLLNRTDAATHYNDTYYKLVAEFNSVWFNSSGNSYSNNAQTANALALALPGVVPDALRAAVAKNIVADITSKGHFTSGIIGLSQLFIQLSSTGHHDVAVNLASNTNYPSSAAQRRSHCCDRCSLPSSPSAAVPVDRYGWTQNNPFENATTVGGALRQPASAALLPSPCCASLSLIALLASVCIRCGRRSTRRWTEEGQGTPCLTPPLLLRPRCLLRRPSPCPLCAGVCCSHNHHMFSAGVGSWVWRSVAGIHPNGLQAMLIHPRLQHNHSLLSSVNAETLTSKGRVSVSWESEWALQQLAMNVSLPPNAQAKLVVETPVKGGRWSRLSLNGQWLLNRQSAAVSSDAVLDGVQAWRENADGAVELEALSGSYAFVGEWE